MAKALSVTYKLDIGPLERLPKVLDDKFYAVVEKFAFDIKAKAQYYVPVDQGAAKASIYVVTERLNEKDEAIATAKHLAKTEVGAVPHGHLGRNLQVIDEEDNVKHLHALICVAVIYGYGLEFGFPQNKNPMGIAAKNPGASRPYLRPAVEFYHDPFLQAVSAVFDQLRGI